MGTEWSLLWCSPPSISEKSVREPLENVFSRIISQMSTWESESEISQFNRLAPGSTLKIGPDFQQCLNQAINISRQSRGAFHPALGTLISRRGFGSTHLQDTDELKASDTEVFAAITPEAGIIKQLGGIKLDLSAIAKGYAVDEMMATLSDLGITQCLAEIGGEFCGSGVKPDGLPWWVDLERETSQSILGKPYVRIALFGLSLATSGAFRQLNQQGDKSLSHIVSYGDETGEGSHDPDLSTVSVLHKDCMSADGWATALFALGLKKGLALSEKLELTAIFQRVGGELQFSPQAESLRL